MNSVVYFEIQSAIPEMTIQFYQAAFGWKFVREIGMPVDYWRIETTGIRGALLRRPAATPPSGYGTNAFVCSMEVADFDRTAEILLSHGGQIALPKFPIPGKCWQGYFIDNDGNTFGIFQVDETAG